VEIEKDTISPNESTYINTFLDLSGYNGQVRQTFEIHLKNDMGEKQVIGITLMANVQHPFTLSRSIILFQDIEWSKVKKQMRLTSDLIILSPVFENLGIPQIQVPEEARQALTIDIEAQGADFVFKVNFLPHYLRDILVTRQGTFDIKIFSDLKETQYVILPVRWNIKSYFDVSPNNIVFIDKEPQFVRSLVIGSVLLNSFKIKSVFINNVPLNDPPIAYNSKQKQYWLDLIALADRLDINDKNVRSEIVIETDQVEEPILKIPIIILSSAGD